MGLESRCQRGEDRGKCHLENYALPTSSRSSETSLPASRSVSKMGNLQTKSYRSTEAIVIGKAGLGGRSTCVRNRCGQSHSHPTAESTQFPSDGAGLF